MVIRTNENFGSDTVTYVFEYATVDDQIRSRVQGVDSDHPLDRSIAVTGFGMEFFHYQEPSALRSLLNMMGDTHQRVAIRAIREIRDCLDTEMGINRYERAMFFGDAQHHDLLRRVLKSVNSSINKHRKQRKVREMCQQLIDDLTILLSVGD